jgi:hypothetical protein
VPETAGDAAAVPVVRMEFVPVLPSVEEEPERLGSGCSPASVARTFDGAVASPGAEAADSPMETGANASAISAAINGINAFRFMSSFRLCPELGTYSRQDSLNLRAFPL